MADIHWFLSYMCIIWTLEAWVDSLLSSDSLGHKLIIGFLLAPSYATSLLVVRVRIWAFLAMFSCPSVCCFLLPRLCTFLFVSVEVVIELLNWMSRDEEWFNKLDGKSWFHSKQEVPVLLGALCSSVVAVVGLLMGAWLHWNQNLTQPWSIVSVASLWFLFVWWCKLTNSTVCSAF